MNVETLRDLFVAEIQRVYGIETLLVDELAALERDIEVDALDDQRETGAREALREAISEHRSETESHAERLEAVLDALDRTPNPRSTPALEGLIEEKELFNNVVLDDEIRPLYYLGTSRQIEQLEITAYERLLRVGAHVDTPAEVIDLLERTLDEEKAMLRTLESLSTGEEFEALLEDLDASSDSD